jgi:hypothetical protein
MEMSKAVKCPNIGTFLAGMKKIQEHISIEKNLMEICDHDKDLVESLRDVFAKFLKLDTDANFEEVFNNSDNYVLKPQREGGGNNFYNQDIKFVHLFYINFVFFSFIFSNYILRNLLTKIKELEQNPEARKGENDIYDKNIYIAMEFLRPLVSDNYIISATVQQKLNKSIDANDSAIPAPIKNDKFMFKKALITNELGIYGVTVR